VDQNVQEGAKDEKETSYTYSDAGLILKTIKPDGLILENKYDELSNKIEIKSSYESIHYKFSYNQLLEKHLSYVQHI